MGLTRGGFVTGVAGFIGSHLADWLLESADRVSGVDNLSLDQARRNTTFCFFENDVSRHEQACEGLLVAYEWGGKPDIIWHLAANIDIPAGTADASVDFKRTMQTTFTILRD